VILIRYIEVCRLRRFSDSSPTLEPHHTCQRFCLLDRLELEPEFADLQFLPAPRSSANMEGISTASRVHETADSMLPESSSLKATEDKFGGVIIDSHSLPEATSVFLASLKHSLTQWRSQVSLALLIFRRVIFDYEYCPPSTGNLENLAPG
jgi:hypothetical protein